MQESWLRKYIAAIVLMVFANAFLLAQHKTRIFLPEPIVCKGHFSADTTHHFVRHASLKSITIAETENAVFEVDYVSSVPNEVKEAVEYATQQWSKLIYSPIPIRVRLHWSPLESGTLGSASPYTVLPMPELPDTTICYPVSLAEKILGKPINASGTYDLVLYLNSSLEQWYFGTDGSTPFLKYDLVSTIMHELGHGLGFTGSFNVNKDGIGQYGYWDTVPKIYDLFVENGTKQRFLDKTLFTNPSVKLGNGLTSGEVYFGGDYIEQVYGTNIPRLYAPSTWNSGSSISHLNDATYPKGNENSLMTSSTSNGEAMHHPGPITLDILSQMGWYRTNIYHTPLKDTEKTGTIKVGAEIKSDVPASTKNYKLYYSFDNFLSSKVVSLVSAGNYQYEANISVNAKGTTVHYYFTANDNHDRLYRKPFIEGESYSFYVGEDTIKPNVEHYSFGYIFLGEDTVEIEAAVDDNVGVKSVVLEYFINSGEPVTVNMNNDSANIYKTTLEFDGSLAYNDTVFYKIIAADISSNQNVTAHPEGGWFNFRVESILEPVTEYFNDFNTYNPDFLGVRETGVTNDDITFLMSVPDGLENGCLHTPNPYKGTLLDEEYYEYIAQLKYPIILQENAVLRFDEIVLVEPGDVGTKYGDTGFWDYVITEASNDNGKTWKALRDGYDSRIYREWEFLYNSGIEAEGGNSKAVATPSNYKSRHLSIMKNTGFEAGDIALIRFRMQSDALATGWGWAIDNLQIQGDIMADEVLSHKINLDVYPNPGNNILNVDAFFGNHVSLAETMLTDLSGKIIYHEYHDVFNEKAHIKINVSTFNPGLYFLRIAANHRQETVKVVVY